MGYQNANLVAVHGGYLPGASFRVLMRMAMSTDDKDSRPRYFAGPGPMLLILGRPEPEPTDRSAEAISIRHANAVALRSAVAPLRDAGIVSYAVEPTRHRTPEYWLHLNLLGAGKSCANAQGNPASKPDMAQGNPAPRPRSAQENPAPIDKDLLEIRTSDKGETRSSSVVVSPASMIGKTNHGCIRGWMPGPDGTRSSVRCQQCPAPHLRITEAS